MPYRKVGHGVLDPDLGAGDVVRRLGQSRHHLPHAVQDLPAVLRWRGAHRQAQPQRPEQHVLRETFNKHNRTLSNSTTSHFLSNEKNLFQFRLLKKITFL